MFFQVSYDTIILEPKGLLCLLGFLLLIIILKLEFVSRKWFYF
nr:MAG TPA: hypothetical protein [Caudoviricetes sp.]